MQIKRDKNLMLLNWNYEKLKQITNGTNNINKKNFKVTGFSIDSRSLKKEIYFVH